MNALNSLKQFLGALSLLSLSVWAQKGVSLEDLKPQVYQIEVSSQCKFLEYQASMNEPAKAEKVATLVLFEVKSAPAMKSDSAKMLSTFLESIYQNSDVIVFHNISQTRSCHKQYMDQIKRTNADKKVLMISINEKEI